MSLLNNAYQFVLHLDLHLQQFTLLYGSWVYALLFVIILCETGLVIMPFLPGDSLLFAAGSIGALGGMNVHLLVILLFIAAVAGDNFNYFIGHHFGRRLFQHSDSRIFNKKHLATAHKFYEKHGAKAIIIARFMPFIRTFTPCVAGMASMYYPRFLTYDILGGLLWVGGIIYSSYLFGNIPFIKQHFSIIVLAILGISVLPIGWQLIKAWLASKSILNEQE